MKIKWQFPITSRQAKCSLASDIGYFVKSASAVSYLYLSNDSSGEFITQIDLDADGKCLLVTDYPIPSHPPYPSQWFLFELDSKTCLCADLPGWYISPSEHRVVRDDSQRFAQIFAKYHNPTGVDDREYIFGDRIVSQKGAFSYRCRSRLDRKLLWQKTVKGYLYTEMQDYHGKILFGTAEHGGRLYCVDPENGQTVFEIDTHGTSRYAIQEHWCYCYRIGKNAALLKVDLTDGSTSEFPLPGTAKLRCPIAVIDGTIYALTLHPNGYFMPYPVLYAIEE